MRSCRFSPFPRVAPRLPRFATGGEWGQGRLMARVLIVEDEPVIAILLGMVLRRLGHAVMGVEGTEAGAVAAAARERPGLILLDNGLREGSGAGALARILRDGFIPHVYLNGSRAQQAGPGIAVLEKPFTEGALEQAVAAALAGQGE